MLSQHKLFQPCDGYQVVTSEGARYWLSHFNYDKQRKIRPAHVSQLALEMQEGRFREKTQVNFCKLDDTFHLTNGQHTLSAIVQSGVSCLLSVVVLEVEDEEQIADDFTRHDTHLTRTMSDSLIAHNMHDWLGVSRTDLGYIASACVYRLFMEGRIQTRAQQQVSHDVKLNAVREYGSSGTYALRLFDGRIRDMNFLRRKTTLAPAMIAWDHDPILCGNFYGVMAEDDGLRRKDPRKTLLDFLRMTTTLGGAFTAAAGKKPMPDHMLVKAQALAWNAFVDDRELSFLRPDRQAKTVTFRRIGTYRLL